MLAGLLRHARAINRDCPNFLDKKDGRFSELTGTCQSVAGALREQGVGAQVKHAQVNTPEEEDLFWNAGAMGIFSPKDLVRAVFIYVGKVYAEEQSKGH